MVDSEPVMSIRDWREAAGAWAVYAVPYPTAYASDQPLYYNALPVLFWVLAEDDDGHELVGMVSSGPALVPADAVTPGELIGYYRPADGEAHQKRLFALAHSRGLKLHEAAYPPRQVAPPALEPEPQANPVPPKRSRRRLKSSSPESQE